MRLFLLISLTILLELFGLGSTGKIAPRNRNRSHIEKHKNDHLNKETHPETEDGTDAEMELDEEEAEGDSDQPEIQNPLMYTEDEDEVPEGFVLEGDTIVPIDEFEPRGQLIDTMGASVGNRYLWPKGIVPYVIDASLWSSSNLIKKAFKQFHDKTCVRFVPRENNHDTYVWITNGRGCSSLVGYWGRGMQRLNLGSGCVNIGTIVHELGHLIGFHHEHIRSDRDKFIQIFWNNIQPFYKSQFEKVRSSDNVVRTKYDYASIMHYGEFAFSKGSGPSMVPKLPNRKILEAYEKPGLAKSDVKSIKRAYKC